MIDISRAVLYQEDVVGITLRFESECTSLKEIFEFNTTLRIIEEEVNVLILLYNNFTKET